HCCKAGVTMPCTEGRESRFLKWLVFRPSSVTADVILQTEMPTIPHCDELFHRYFAPWYSDDDLASRGFDATRPDMLQFSVHVGKPASALSPLHDEDQERYIHHVSVTMTDAAVGDFGNLLELSSPVDFDWIQSIDDYYNVDRIAELIAESDPTKDGNSYFITCIEHRYFDRKNASIAGAGPRMDGELALLGIVSMASRVGAHHSANALGNQEI
ncbi:hypothetical protein, partial [Roseiconus lacunae]|uniref:hypothetical protein n=1 Tax=Roseiconus lacunae TaxID=2605694 RepID=UPI001E4C016F